MRAKSQCLALDTVATRVDPNSTFNLHKSCAEELSREIIEHPIHWHKLTFECKTELSAELFTCNACHQPCRLAYTCFQCHIAFDLKCASNWRHILDNEEYHVHQFSVLRKGRPFDCEVCGKSQDSLPYLCTICRLLVCKECTQSLPHTIKITLHQHPLRLIWFLEEGYPKDQICKICYTSTNKSRAVYQCKDCDYVSHTLCFRLKGNQVDYRIAIWERLLRNTFPLEDISPSLPFRERRVKNISHDHILTLIDELRDNDAITCNGCMKPITISTGRHPQVKLGSSYKLDAHPHIVTCVDKRKSVIPFDKRERILPCHGHALSNIATLVFVVMMAFSGACSGAVYRVGDSAGWTSRGLVDYNKWALAKDFNVGDTLIFAYNNQFHTVMQVSDQDFQSCNASAISTYTSGSDTITLKRPGHYYFLCGAPGHCQNGQKVDIKVTLPVPKSSIPSPSPSPYGFSPPSASHPEEISPSSTLNFSKLGFAITAFMLSLLRFVF
ncbi:PREDICTED: mavicyanin [Prunus dulcis]|uniref:PREDICTED: mavicyanin n=1 Tax=Prunus dulcis TaxID=3755 RepID=A0A5E4GF97_PRUDU|nr:PREDICTED: mavicyanin [Prunus dulcis]